MSTKNISRSVLLELFESVDNVTIVDFVEETRFHNQL